jgi:hypothetical protein
MHRYNHRAVTRRLGWRGLSDDAQRVAFWVTVLGTVATAAIVGSAYVWWSWYWDVPPELKLGQGAALVTAFIVLSYAVLIALHNYFGWPRHHPLHQRPRIVEVEKVVERVVEQVVEIDRPVPAPPMIRAGVPTVPTDGPAPEITVTPYEGEEAILYIHNTGGDGVLSADAQIVNVDVAPVGHAAPYRMRWRDTTTHKVIKEHECLVPSGGRLKLLVAHWASGGDWGKPSLVVIGDDWAVDSYRHDPWEKRSPIVTIEITIHSVPSLSPPFTGLYSVYIPPKTLRKVVIEQQGS